MADGIFGKLEKHCRVRKSFFWDSSMERDLCGGIPRAECVFWAWCNSEKFRKSLLPHGEWPECTLNYVKNVVLEECPLWGHTLGDLQGDLLRFAFPWKNPFHFPGKISFISLQKYFISLHKSLISLQKISSISLKKISHFPAKISSISLQKNLFHFPGDQASWEWNAFKLNQIMCVKGEKNLV